MAIFSHPVLIRQTNSSTVITYDVQTGGQDTAVDQIVSALSGEAPADGAALRTALARRAPHEDEVLVSGYLKHAINLSRKGDYAKAIELLTLLKSVAPNNAQIFQELGITYGKLNALDLAEVSLRHALSIEPEHAEIWANLGGIQRRKALSVSGHIDKIVLQEARDSYTRSAQLDPSHTYPLTNLMRIDLLLSMDSSLAHMHAREDFEHLESLCREKLTASPHDYWIEFDLADAVLFRGAPTDALALFERAIADTPLRERPFVFKTVENVVDELLRFQVGDQAQQETLRIWRSKLEL